MHRVDVGRRTGLWDVGRIESNGGSYRSLIRKRDEGGVQMIDFLRSSSANQQALQTGRCMRSLPAFLSSLFGLIDRNRLSLREIKAKICGVRFQSLSRGRPVSGTVTKFSRSVDLLIASLRLAKGDFLNGFLRGAHPSLGGALRYSTYNSQYCS